MTAVVKAFRSRADLRMVAPRSVSRNINPATGGSACHWEGPHMGITAATPHSVCEEKWRAIQSYHMGRLGWVDIAYTGGYCQHGYALAGRGFGIRTAANGTDNANGSYYALCFLGGVNDFPTQDAINALEWWVNQARRAGKAGLRVRPHSAFFQTACCGKTLTAAAARLDGRVIVPPTRPAPTVKQWQTLLEVTADGAWGPVTDQRSSWVTGASKAKAGTMHGIPRDHVRTVQRVIDTLDDGVWGPKSRAAMTVWTRQAQTLLRVPTSGNWDTPTGAAYTRLRNTHR